MAGDPRMGEILRDGDRVGLRFRRRLRHDPDKVWRALTESEHLRYWMPCDVVGERRAGADITLPFWPEHVEAYNIDEPVLRGRIIAWEPPRRFEWTWGGDVLRFELEATDDGTHLTFTTWLEDGDPEAAANTAGGYHVCLDHLERLLDGGAGAKLTDPDVQSTADRLTTAYGEVLSTRA
jgi:uncharacterized protein YndB with AHSA1/START domain